MLTGSEHFGDKSPSARILSDSFKVLHCTLALVGTRIARSGLFDQKNVGLSLPGNGAVLCAAWHNTEITGLKPKFFALPDLDGETAFQHEKKLVRALVLVPLERAFELGDLNVLAVQFPDNPRGPLLVELR